MRNRFKVKSTSLIREKNYFLIQGTITRGRISSGMNMEFSDSEENLSLLPIVDIGFARIKKGSTISELAILCIPYEDETMLRAYQRLNLVGKSFVISRPALKLAYRKPLVSTKRISGVREEPAPYGKSAVIRRLSTSKSRSAKKVAASPGTKARGYKRATKKKK